MFSLQLLATNCSKLNVCLLIFGSLRQPATKIFLSLFDPRTSLLYQWLTDQESKHLILIITIIQKSRLSISQRTSKTSWRLRISFSGVHFQCLCGNHQACSRERPPPKQPKFMRSFTVDRIWSPIRCIDQHPSPL